MLVLSGQIANFTPILLAFAWTQSPNAPVILGHLNFFAEFNVCFYRHELAFEICPKPCFSESAIAYAIKLDGQTQESC
ncbi:hypothetical protein [Umezakia ovalisporum]|uniref:Uncharacterized protein n=1 Tax=Umezakia ovalisporum FSS-62 TaxID=2971776 RepID=A0AA43H2D0_9CYAN|nr:hypothetical protein [Umezakia ovalisporum FSS-62]MDH6103651.1 hypothetical protein [Umezakia ovalisporum ANA283AFssAo]